MAATTLRRVRGTLLEPARNLHACGLLTFAVVVLLIVEGSLLSSKVAFALAAAPTIVLGLLGLHVIARSDDGRFERALARAANGVGLALRPAGTPSVFAVLLYCTGVIGIVAGYAWLALTPTGIGRDDVIVQWGLLDKRQLVFAYLAVVAFLVFHHAMVRLFFAPPYPMREAWAPARRRRIGRLLGAVVVAVLAYGLFGASALRQVVPAGDGLAAFYEYHSLVHLGALEQIRLGALPYVEARTQYGLGNQLLAYFLTQSMGFGNHGLYAGVLLVDVVCIVAFFVIVQQLLGLGWALAGLLGWMLWPSPASVLDVPGWAILTRWIAVPILAVLLARFLLAAPRATWFVPVLAGLIWGAGGFMSQENVSAGLLVLLLSLALYGPASDLSLAALTRIAALFLASGAVAFAALVAASIGIGHSLDVLRQASAQSGLVMAGVSNSVWSDNAGVTLTLEIVHGWLYDQLKTHGDLRPVLLTYGFALLLMIAVGGLLARFLARSWNAAAPGQRAFTWKFAGVAVGAYVLHLFALLRSDLSHLAGPSFLLPMFLLALPVFAWRCLAPGLGRGILLLISVGVIADAAIANRTEVGRRIGALADVGRDSVAALDVYRELRAAGDRPLDIASRYSPIPRYQAAFRDRPAFAELEELSRLLHEKLRGRPVELVLSTPDDPMNDPELLYFFGGFRSITGITSPRGSLWLRSDEDAWIDRILKARNACVFFDARTIDSRLFRAWNDASRNGEVTNEPIVGKRSYGVLSCKA